MSDYVKSHPGGIKLLQKNQKNAENHYIFHGKSAKTRWFKKKIATAIDNKYCTGCIACTS